MAKTIIYNGEIPIRQEYREGGVKKRKDVSPGDSVEFPDTVADALLKTKQWETGKGSSKPKTERKGD